jgi:hypothetical protein
MESHLQLQDIAGVLCVTRAIQLFFHVESEDKLAWLLCCDFREHRGSELFVGYGRHSKTNILARKKKVSLCMLRKLH